MCTYNSSHIELFSGTVAVSVTGCRSAFGRHFFSPKYFAVCGVCNLFVNENENYIKSPIYWCIDYEIIINFSFRSIVNDNYEKNEEIKNHTKNTAVTVFGGPQTMLVFWFVFRHVIVTRR